MGRHQARHANCHSSTALQDQLNAIAGAQAHKPPARCHPLTTLYASALLLPHLLFINNSTARISTSTSKQTPQRSERETGVSLRQSLATAANLTPQSSCQNPPPRHWHSSAIGAVAAVVGTEHAAPASKPMSTYAESGSASFFGLPLASAAPANLPTGAVQWDQNKRLFTVNDDAIKALALCNLKDFFVKNKILSLDDAEKFEFYLRDKGLGAALIIAAKDEGLLLRQKRVNREKFVRDHIERNCAFESEIYDTVGNNQGNVLLFKAQRAENPFRMLFDNRPHSSPSIDERGIADGLNLAADIWTVGIKPLIGNLVAQSFRREHYKNQGDKICADRQNHLSLAEISGFLDVSGLQFQHRNVRLQPRPQELLATRPLTNRASYFARNRKTGVQRELLLQVVGSGTRADHGSEILIRKNANGEFMTHHPNAHKPELLKRRVIVDETAGSWRYADSFDQSALNVEMQQGKNFIDLYGNKYELQMRAKQQYEIVVESGTGIKQYHPVYMEPLSQTWHLKTQNHKEVFNQKHNRIIDRLKLVVDPNNNYYATDNLSSAYYGEGKIFEVRPRGQDIRTSPPLYTAVEIRGELVPVKTSVVPGHGVRYDAYRLNAASKTTHPIEWDGNRWIFESPTSAHVSQRLGKAITPDRYSSQLNVMQLSAPDHQGVRWTAHGDGFLKIKKHYVNIKKLNANRFLVPSKTGKSTLYLRYKGNQFELENFSERMSNLLSVGLSGVTKKETAQQYLSRLPGYGNDRARLLLEQYRFPTDDLTRIFVRNIELKNEVPMWANKYKKENVLGESSAAGRQGSAASSRQSFTVLSPDNPVDKIALRLGTKIGEGEFATVFLDDGNPSYVIKKYKTNRPDQKRLADKEADAFRKYYGDDSAKVYVDEKGVVYVQMFKVPGKPLTAVPENSLPPDAPERFVDMLERLNTAGIIHSDIHADNIMWDASTNAFYPIDISGTKEAYFKNNRDGKASHNRRGEEQWDAILDEIYQKMPTETELEVDRAGLHRNPKSGAAPGSSGQRVS